jgi:peptidoglycan/xylan/chitin deacetylase (PgdA/CDA1 family)
MSVDVSYRDMAQRVTKFGASLVPAGRGTVILAYHRVGGLTALEVDLPTALFAEQVARLATAGRASTLEAAIPRLSGAAGSDSPSSDSPSSDAPPAVVTFDDGTADFAEVALPVLVEHRLPVTLYLATAFVEEQRRFPDDGQPLSWDALRDACATGLVDVGSHTHTHALLDRLPAAEIADELDRSQKLIEDRLGRPCLDFAYPKALPPSAAADAAVRARFRSAAVAGTRPNPPGRTDVHLLSRSPIQRGDGMKYFEEKLAGGMALEDTVRRVANKWRYRRATT